MKGLKKVGKVLNTDVGKLARSVKRGMARKKVRKARMDKMADKTGHKLRKKAGFEKYKDREMVRDNPTKREQRQNRKKYWKGRETYNKRAGVTKGMEKASQRVTDRRIARRQRQDAIAKRKAKGPGIIGKVKRGLLKRKAKKSRMDRYVEKQNVKMRKKAGMDKWRDKTVGKEGTEKRKNWLGQKASTKRKAFRGARDTYNKRAGVTKGMQKAERRAEIRRAERRERQWKISQKKKKASNAMKAANKSQIAAAKRNRNIAQGKLDYKKGMTTAQYAASLKDKD